ncbi:EamA family transporter [Methylocapsa sp. S129]|uniref:EamA family transporter n=1 Tax=Methylocapsa sp. S129 TaxID=1641869 RepID=UPI00131C7F99|nr:EamA family transporter [Methylocapsa sp. S129]
MSSGVMAAVLFAAALHALWNSIVKSGSDKFAAAAVVCLWCGLIALCAALPLPAPAPESWPYVGASAVTHVVYFLLVGRLYRNADLSAAYPIMRGAAPLLTTIGAWLYLGESLDPAVAGGIALLIGGVFWMAVEGVRRGGVDRAALLAALVNAAVIALYSLIDGAGARLSAQAFAYNAWTDALTAVLFAPVILLLRGSGFVFVFVREWRRGLIGGAAAFSAYAIVVWAMTQAPIGLVAALRETSVIFAAVIGAFFLHENFKAPRYAAAAFIAAGIIVLRLG